MEVIVPAVVLATLMCGDTALNTNPLSSVVAGSAPSSLVTTTHPLAAGPLPSLKVQEEERANVGFRHDAAYVSAVDQTGSRENSLGIPLTPSETSELQATVALQNATAPIQQLLSTVPAFVDAWVSPKAGLDQLNISSTAPLYGPLKKRIQSSVAPASVKFHIVHTSLLDLERLFGRVQADNAYWHGRKIGYIGVALTAQGDDVTVTIKKSAPRSAKATIAARYGNPRYLRIVTNP